ncbi:MAG: hypothetical protein MN733_21425, partial [Nitrososphaera sp.]|nr:hypothetical protein [Nitrososphaera sp.]
IDVRGRFAGTAIIGGRPRQAKARAREPSGPAPTNLGQDKEAAWLKEIWEDGTLVFVTQQGKEVVKKDKQVQSVGKKNPLTPGKWYILSGQSSVRPAP